MDHLVEKTYMDHCLSEPLLTTSDAVDFEKVGPITAEFVAFIIQLAAIYKKTTGNPLPVYSDDADAPDVWKSVIRIIDQKSPSAAGLFKQYFAWTYNEWETPVYEIGSRPPVGRYAPPPKPRLSTPGSKNSERSGKPSDRRESQPGNERGGSRYNPTNNRARRAPPADTRDNRTVESAQSVVQKAVATLTGDPRLEFVDLPAANSFQRRQQHHFANELGFHTKSIGEGTTRAVRISRGANQ